MTDHDLPGDPLAGAPDDERDDAFEPTCEGRLFPSEAEWLDLEPPPISGDFVARTLEALSPAGAPDDAALARQPGLPGDLLAGFAAPAPSADFVARTVRALDGDRRHRWREILARHVAPEPAPEFVARTLAALAADRQNLPLQPQRRDAGGGQSGGGRFGGAWPDAAARTRRWRNPALVTGALVTVALVTVAAAGLALAVWWPTSSPLPLEERFAQHTPAAYAFATTPSPLPSLLSQLAGNADPYALPAASPDGVWLAYGGPVTASTRGPR